ncbi:hypothetical protein [Prochlorococcus sp. MIT 1011]|uniref:hypothetical protein n=1 Tax=Prochlorococcus sp. MIT 1011 TaxID=3082520 RepID=UPI0039B4EC11
MVIEFRTGGNSLDILKSSNQLNICPDKYREVITAPSSESMDFCDKDEWYYFLKKKDEIISYKDLGWSKLTLQEKK